jgi:Fe-S cluster biogenesis protein NfuA
MLMEGHDNSNTLGGGSDQPQPVSIRTQMTPNPNAWKYILSKDVKSTGKVTYTEIPQCDHVPLAAALLRLANVTQVHLFENVLTITQNGASDWGVLDSSAQAVIGAHIHAHDPNFIDHTGPGGRPAKDRSLLPAEVAAIEEILDRTIRPGLQADGGDVEVLELDGNILTIRYQGACGGCPSSMMGTLQAIESILRTEFNPYLEVVAL